MEYYKRTLLKNGKECVIRSGKYADGAAVLENFNRVHGETDFLLSYPDENSFTAEQESEFLFTKLTSEREVQLIAVIGGEIAGTAGVTQVGGKRKIRHRAEYGISISEKFWGIGIGSALTDACIECAERAGFEQLELSVAAENKRAVALYKKKGFVEYGRNPHAFKLSDGTYREFVLMYKTIG